MTDPQSWTPLGEALADYAAGRLDATPVVFFEDGPGMDFPAEALFRPSEELPDAEDLALEMCHGRVLDAGAGAGSHALMLEERGLEVTALDVCPRAVAVMRQRGVRDPRQGDVFTFAGTFDTVLLLMNGLGLVGDLEGLRRFLVRAHELVADGGQILFDSADLRRLDDREEQERIARRRRAGRYHGETRQQIEYEGRRGLPFDWLYADPRTLRHWARDCGWHTQVAFADDDGGYLARLIRK